jgi:tetrahydromethanopterin S-methyltransferase subunit G
MKKLLTALAMLAITVPAVADDQFSLGTGFDYSSGKYGNATSQVQQRYGSRIGRAMG